MLRAEESLLNSKDDLLEKTERIYAHRTNTQRCWQAASRVLILTPLLLSIVLFVVYFRDVAKPLDLVAGNTTTKPQITANKGMKRDFGIFLHPEDHVLREPNVLRLSWNITKAIIAPDGVEKNVFLINGTTHFIKKKKKEVLNNQLMYKNYINRSIPRAYNRGATWRYPGGKYLEPCRRRGFYPLAWSPYERSAFHLSISLKQS